MPEGFYVSLMGFKERQSGEDKNDVEIKGSLITCLFNEKARTGKGHQRRSKHVFLQNYTETYICYGTLLTHKIIISIF